MQPRQPRTHQFQSCIDACLQCAQACDECASLCLLEENVSELAHCIRMNLDCAAICLTAAHFITNNSEHAVALCELCAEVCDACEAECLKFPMDYCQACAKACEVCADECRKMAQMAKG